jgi:Domain of unknown function (DUF4296)
MRSLFPVIAGLIILASCSGKKKLPTGILPRDKMEAVMWDMMQADVFLSDFVLNKDTSLKKFEEHTKLYEKVFQIHKTNNEQFARSFNYYRSHTTLMKQVLDSLNTRQNEEIKEQIKPLQVEDSLLNKRKEIPPVTISAQ